MADASFTLTRSRLGRRWAMAWVRSKFARGPKLPSSRMTSTAPRWEQPRLATWAARSGNLRVQSDAGMASIRAAAAACTIHDTL